MVNHQHGYRVGVHGFRLGKIRDSVHERETPQIAGLATDAGHSSQTARRVRRAGSTAGLGGIRAREPRAGAHLSRHVEHRQREGQRGQGCCPSFFAREGVKWMKFRTAGPLRNPQAQRVSVSGARLLSIALLIELSPMVPFPSVVPLQILRPTFGANAPPPDPGRSPRLAPLPDRGCDPVPTPMVHL